MANYEKITELLKDESMVQKAQNCKTMEEFNDFFNSNGAEITMEETVELISKIAEEKEKRDNGELSSEELDKVAGGFVISGGLAIAACIGFGITCIGAAAGGAYTAYQALRWGNKH